MTELFFDPTSVPYYVWVVCVCFGLVFFVQLFYYLYFYRGILVWSKKMDNLEVPLLDRLPGVSIVICAREESENLRAYLPSILSQNYPNYEVIVVNDGSMDETEKVLHDLEFSHPNLYHTYVPEEAKVMSSKKLALTVGIKAAKNEIVVLTDADCEPVGENWLRSMARNFTQQKDFVLGYGAYRRSPGVLSHLISYDTFFIALQYMGFAVRGVPYMGVGRNLAYRTEVFFKNKGFASILHLQSGDDDLFVNANVTKRNVRIEVSPESVTLSEPKTTFRQWFYQKERHLSSSPYYRRGSKWLIGVEQMSRGLFYALLIATIIVSPLIVCLSAILLFLIRYLVQLSIINKSAKQLGERRFYLSILAFDVFLPIVSLYILIETKLQRKRVYKWK